MQTRRRTASQSVENTEKPVETKKKVQQKPKPDALVASIITSIKEENSTQKATEANNTSNASKSVSKKPAAPKTVRGLPKSGRPWKEKKQKWVARGMVTFSFH